MSNENKKIELDTIDKQILNILQDDGSISNLELSKRVELAPSSCLLRVKNLKEKGVIKNTVTILDEKLLGYTFTAFIKVELRVLTKESIDEFTRYSASLDRVLECYMITGNDAFLLKIVARDLDDYRAFILNELVKIPSVSNVETSIVISVAKETNKLPIR